MGTVLLWVLLIAGPFFGWTVGSARSAPLYLDDWHLRLGVRVALGAGLPLLLFTAVLLLRRHQPREVMAVAVAALLGALTALPAVLDLRVGVQWQTVDVRESLVASAPRGGTCCPSYAMYLRDGRTLRYGVAAANGPVAGAARVALLSATGSVLSVDGARKMERRGSNPNLLLLATVLLGVSALSLLWAHALDRRGALLRDTLNASARLGGGWLRGQAQNLDVFLATRRTVNPKTGAVDLKVLIWSARLPEETPLQIGADTLRLPADTAQLDGPALFLLPLSPHEVSASERAIEAALQAQGFAKLTAPALPVRPPPGEGVTVWRRHLGGSDPLMVYGERSGGRILPARPDLPLLLAASSADPPQREVAWGSALVGDNILPLIGAVLALCAAGLAAGGWLTR